VAFVGTVAVICVPPLTVKAADVPLNFTAVAPVNVVPVIVTLVPGAPLVGENAVICDGTEKAVALVAVPSGVVTAIAPEVAPAGTVAVILIAELTVNTADAPLKVTAVAPVKFAPLMTTLVPPAPLAGVKPVMLGATMKLVALVAVATGVATLRGRVVAWGGTVNVT